jgi:hypothetical protein
MSEYDLGLLAGFVLWVVCPACFLVWADREMRKPRP